MVDKPKVLLNLCLLAGIGCTSFNAALAQQPEEQARTNSMLEEIIVTAEKREESVMKVPMAISAFTEETIKRRRISELEDIAMQTPGLTFEDYTSGGFATPVIRGLAELNIVDLEQNVSTFFDGIYLPRAYMVDIGMVGLERIEVVKGPQSALYGRNSFAGAINYVTKRPGQELDIQADITAGTDDLFEASGEVGLPIIADVLGVRVGAAHSEFDGTWENLHPLANEGIRHGVDGNLGGWDKDVYYVTVEWTPITDLRLTGSYFGYDVSRELRGTFVLEEIFDGLNCGAPNADGQPQMWCGELPKMPDLVVDPRGVGLKSKSDFLRFAADWQLNNSVSLHYLFGDVQSDATAFNATTQDFLTAPVITFVGVPNGDIEATSHELRVDFDMEGPLSGRLGMYLSETIDFADVRLAPVTPLGEDPLTDPGNSFSVGATTTDVDDQSIFAEVSIRMLDDRATLSIAARYTEEEKTVTTVAASGTTAFSDTFSSVTPRVSLDYQLNDQLMVYGSVAKGVKAGGFNGVVFVESERTYDQEENWTYEAGLKGLFYDGRLQFAGALFYTDWTDLQTGAFPSGGPPGVPTAQIVLTLGSATAPGVELEGALAVTDNFAINFGGSYTDSEFEDGVTDPAFVGLCDDVVCPTSLDISGNTLRRQAATQLLAGFTFESTFGGGFEYYIRGDIAYQSKQYQDNFNLSWIGDRTVADASIGVSFNRFDVQLWARNLFDAEYLANSLYDTGRQDTRISPTFGEQQRFGLTLGVSFGD